MVIGCCLQEQDHGERCDRDDGPENDAQHQRLEAYLADYLYGEPSADQEQRGRKSAACGDRNAVRELGRQVAVGVYEHGNDEPEDEPGDLDLLAFLTEDQGRHQRQGDDPQGAGEFDGRGYLERLLAVGGTGADDRTGVVDGDRGPGSELGLPHAEPMPDDGEYEEGDGVEDEDRGQ